MAKLTDFRTTERPSWCPGCGDFAVLTALQKAAAELGLEPEDVGIVSGIGCSGKLPSYFKAYGMHGIHGRALPIATGLKLGNRDLTVIAVGGDGDGYGIGAGHLVHALRRNLDMTYIVMDNSIYGLTKGQQSPTSRVGFRTKANPMGVIERPIHPLELAISAGGTFVAQGFSGEVNHVVEVVKAAIRHKGFSLVNVFSPCVTFNREKTYDWYRENVVNVDEDPAFNRHDRISAMTKVMETKGMAIGIIYQEKESQSYDDLIPGFEGPPVAFRDLDFDSRTFEKILAEF